MDEELLKRLYSEPHVKLGGVAKKPSEIQKKHLLALWPFHNKVEVARAIGVSVNTARAWYKDLTREK